MALSRRDFAALAVAASVAPATARAQSRPVSIIALGGASLEHAAGTVAAFDLAASEGADFIETGLAASQDGVLVARDEPGAVVVNRHRHAPRIRGPQDQPARIDGGAVEGWFTPDFSLAELKTLICSDPYIKPRGHAPAEAPPRILTFQEVMDIARAASAREARVIGICATLRHPAWFASIELALEPRTADLIRIAGYDWPAAAMIVQSADADCLRTLGGLTRARRTWLMGPQAAAADVAAARGWADGIEAAAESLFDLSGSTVTATPLAASARAAGLAMQARIEPMGEPFPPQPFRRGDMRGFIAATLRAGVDRLATRGVLDAVKAKGRLALG